MVVCRGGARREEVRVAGLLHARRIASGADVVSQPGRAGRQPMPGPARRAEHLLAA
jgi:hypothetical protein